MTINKSQGQTLSRVGLYLPRPLFRHGQLYVVISRVKTKRRLKILILDEDGNVTNTTKNIVYKEIFETLLTKKQIVGILFIIFNSDFNLFVCINIDELTYLFVSSSIFIFQSIATCVLDQSKIIVKMQVLEGRQCYKKDCILLHCQNKH